MKIASGGRRQGRCREPEHTPRSDGAGPRQPPRTLNEATFIGCSRGFHALGPILPDRYPHTGFEIVVGSGLRRSQGLGGPVSTGAGLRHSPEKGVCMTMSTLHSKLATVSPAQGDSIRRLTEEILTTVFGPVEKRTFTVRFWDGSVDEPRRDPAQFTLVLRHPGALRRMLLLPTHRAMGEAFLRGDFDLEGNVEAAAAAAVAGQVRRRLASAGVLLRLAARLRGLPPSNTDRFAGARDSEPRWRFGGRHSLRRDALAVRSHYDVGNDFYALWLDQRMIYSCGYFPTGHEGLDPAQEAKLELICRKLRLRPGERLLDIGCGWIDPPGSAGPGAHRGGGAGGPLPRRSARLSRPSTGRRVRQDRQRRDGGARRKASLSTMSRRSDCSGRAGSSSTTASCP